MHKFLYHCTGSTAQSWAAEGRGNCRLSGQEVLGDSPQRSCQHCWGADLSLLHRLILGWPVLLWVDQFCNWYLKVSFTSSADGVLRNRRPILCQWRMEGKGSFVWVCGIHEHFYSVTSCVHYDCIHIQCICLLVIISIDVCYNYRLYSTSPT